MSFTPFGPDSFILQKEPYLSRVDQHEISPSDGNSQNYVMLGYVPAQPLQAAELNEIQEHFYRMRSLSDTMNFNWSGGPGKIWDENYPNGSIIPTNAIGIGQEHPDGLSVHGPGWPGTTPLYPFNDPHRDSSSGSNMIDISIGSTITFNFYPGWYLMESRSGTLQALKIWTHLNETKTLTGMPTSGTEYNVGFSFSSNIVTSSDDPSLGDQTGAGSYSSISSDRIQIASIIANTSGIDPNVSAIFKIIPNNGEIRYMNNLLFKTWQ